MQSRGLRVAALVAAAWSMGCGDSSTQGRTPFQGVVTHGLSIPAARPRIWFTPERLTRARSWLASHPWTPAPFTTCAVPRDTPGEEQYVMDCVTHAVLSASAAECRNAAVWAAAKTHALRSDSGAPINRLDGARYTGEAIASVYDWCHDQLSPAEREAFVADTNFWLREMLDRNDYGLELVLNNHFWGHLRNAALWALASYEENVAAAERFLDDVDALLGPGAGTVLTVFAADGGGRGGALAEGVAYGSYLPWYALSPSSTMRAMGRDLDAETGWFRESLYTVVYQTLRTPTTSTLFPSGATYLLFPQNDTSGSGDNLASRALITGRSNAMVDWAGRWRAEPGGGHARAWVNMVGALTSADAGARTERHVASVDPGGSPLALSTLPLDYYASGSRFLWARASSADAATTLMLQLGDPAVADRSTAAGQQGNYQQHAHVDWGTWQLWRNGRFLSRESPGYPTSAAHAVAGYGGVGTADPTAAVPHNTLLVDGLAAAASCRRCMGYATVPRLGSAPDHAYAVANLTVTIADAPGASATAAWNSWVREFVFFRALETLVILDRVESDAAGATRSFLAHCETDPAIDSAADRATCTNGGEAFSMWTLPAGANVTYRKVVEGGTWGQHRIEVDMAPGTAQSHHVHVVQARSAATPPLTPSLADTTCSGAPCYVVTLSAGNSVAFAKGMTSSGGTVTIGGSPRALRPDVQGMTVTAAGPAWQP